jgi:hypothetical protein
MTGEWFGRFMYQYQELTPFPLNLRAVTGGGFGRFIYQYQELTPFPCININN